MKICVSGASGLVGKSFCKRAQAAGHETIAMTRPKSTGRASGVSWDPENGTVDTEKLADVDAVVHLAGESIAEGRWNVAKKARIRNSRRIGTKLIADTLANMENGPRTFVSASAIGFYGERGDETVNEQSAPGSGFLSEVCQDWEAACQSAVDTGIRTVNVRIGVVLSKHGGALQKMLLPFKLGGGGIVGSGKQYWSWISIDDLSGLLLHAVESSELAGPINAVAPQAVTNREFTKTLGKVLRRPTIFPLPAFMARIVLGEMADELILSSIRVEPKQTLASGYKFEHPDLESALRHVLK